MKLQVLLSNPVLLAAVALAQDRPAQLDAHVKKYNLDDSDPDMMARLQIAFDQVNHINNDDGKTYTAALNKFSHWSETTFQRLLGSRSSLTPTTEGVTFLQAPRNTTLPDEVDLREGGCIGPIENQNMCGSCWTFATAQVVSSHKCLKDKETDPSAEPIELSKSQILSCSSRIAGDGCDGGWPLAALLYVKSAGGLLSEQSYSYSVNYFFDLVVKEKCQLHTKSLYSESIEPINYIEDNTKPSKIVNVKNTVESLMSAVANHGPIAVTVGASTWSPYSSGVFTCEGNNTQIDHAVLLVGYGTEDSQDYWLIKNSWGEDWGEDGYIKVYRGTDEENAKQCAILSDHSYYPDI